MCSGKVVVEGDPGARDGSHMFKKHTQMCENPKRDHSPLVQLNNCYSMKSFGESGVYAQ